MAHGKSPRHVRRKRAGRASRSAEASGDSSGDVRDPAPRGTSGRPARGPVRLQKLLAAAGFGSRRSAERYLEQERVRVNGRIARLGDSADPGVDDVRVDGERLARERPVYWIVHKPRGVVTTVRDEAGRSTVMDLVPSSIGRVFPVGRLDRETSGLLLMTNDGDMAHALLHPSLGNEREYRVRVKGQVDERAVRRLERGVSLEEGRTAPAQVSGLRFDPEEDATTFRLTVIEGRKRQIRRSLLQLGFPVRRLARVRMGPLRLGRLGVGEARPLRPDELRALRAHVEQLRSAREARGRRGRSGADGGRSAGSAQRRASSRKGTSR